MEQKTNAFLETQPIGTLMRKHAIPCVISLLVAALYNIVDQLFIADASYLGSYGNAANTVVFPLTVVTLAIAVMIGSAAQELMHALSAADAGVRARIIAYRNTCPQGPPNRRNQKTRPTAAVGRTFTNGKQNISCDIENLVQRAWLPASSSAPNRSGLCRTGNCLWGMAAHYAQKSRHAPGPREKGAGLTQN